MSTDDIYLERKSEEFEVALAKILGLTHDELCELDYFIEDNIGHDDQENCKIIRFRKNLDKYRNRIPCLTEDQVWLDLETWYRLLASTGHSDD